MKPSEKTSRRQRGSRQTQSRVRRVQSALTTIYDPATPNVDLFNMGMIYAIDIDDNGVVNIDLAFSSPGHPGNLALPKQVRDTIKELDGIVDCKVRIVDDPPWSLDRVSEYARIHLSVVGDGGRD